MSQPAACPCQDPGTATSPETSPRAGAEGVDTEDLDALAAQPLDDDASDEAECAGDQERRTLEIPVSARRLIAGVLRVPRWSRLGRSHPRARARLNRATREYTSIEFPSRRVYTAPDRASLNRVSAGAATRPYPSRRQAGGYGSGLRDSSSRGAAPRSRVGARALAEAGASSSTAKPGPQGGELEEHAVRLKEIHRAEVEAVDHLRRGARRRGDTLAPRRQVLRLAGERDVVNLPPPCRGGARRGRVVGEPRVCAPGPRSLPLRALEAHRRPAAARCPPGALRRRERPGSPGGVLGRDLRRDGAQRLLPGGEHSSCSSPSGSANRRLRRERCRPRPRPGAPARTRAPPGAGTRQRIRCTIPAPARPGGAPGYSKNVRSMPGEPCSSP